LQALPGDARGEADLAASPWNAATGFRVGGPPRVRVALRFDPAQAPAALADRSDERHWLAFERAADGLGVELGGRRHRVDLQFADDGTVTGHLDGQPVRARYTLDHERVVVRRQCLRHDFVEDTGAEHKVSAEHEGHFRAPMPGHVLDVRVKPGQLLDKGAVLLVLEAMKMEHSLTAPWPAKVVEVKVQAGQRVEEGTDLVRLEPAV
jgi:3-methylcrotonyl-CoA carboxylase alpha subunit